jgi:hypothetical protein
MKPPNCLHYWRRGVIGGYKPEVESDKGAESHAGRHNANEIQEDKVFL